ncbi:MAG: STAS domain-containing protein [Streptosporangiales bacterium]|nr:STAS domain-containing protein [Streptosporangiales bacterium]
MAGRGTPAWGSAASGGAAPARGGAAPGGAAASGGGAPASGGSAPDGGAKPGGGPAAGGGGALKRRAVGALRSLRPVPPTRGDLVAGVSVALVLVPQALAYAELAGVPPVHGLYAAAAAPIAAALVGSSPYLQTGPVALTSLLTFGALAPIVPAGSVAFASHAALLALLVGVARLLLGLLRWGAVAYLMSLPVVTGFTAAAAILIVASQVPSLVGAGSDALSPAVAAADVLTQPQHWQLGAILIGLVTVAVVVLGRKISVVFPWMLLATVAGLAVSAFGLVRVPVVGDIPSGLPSITLGLPWHAVPDMALAAVVIAVVGFAEPASIARKYAAADRRPWNPHLEFVGQGLANIGAGLAGGYPAGGSFSRSALNRLAGARTRWSGAITGAVVLGVLPFVGVLGALPKAVLAGLVIVAAISLVEISAFRDYWYHSRAQFLVAVPTFVATLVSAPRVERGLLIGVVLAMAVHLWRESRLDVDSWRDGDTLHVRPQGVLYFGSAPALETRLRALLADNPDATRVSIDLHRLGRLDLTGLYVLRGVAEQIRDSGADVEFASIPPHARDRAGAVLGDC